MSNPVTYTVKDPEDYLGGFVATGIVAIVQTMAPLLVAQLWKNSDSTQWTMEQTSNPWYTYGWKAAQAGGVVAFGLQSLGFFAAFIFDLGIMEKLGYLMTWFTHGVLLANLSMMTVVGYFIVGISKHQKTNTGSTSTELWVVLASYVVVQLSLAAVFLSYAQDTVMYLVADEMKDICEKYGALCNDYGVMESSNPNATDVAATNLANWDW